MKEIKVNSVWKRKIVEGLSWKIKVIKIVGNKIYHKLVEYGGESRNTTIDEPIHKDVLLDMYEEE